jgi:hypothetical protein
MAKKKKKKPPKAKDKKKAARKARAHSRPVARAKAKPKAAARAKAAPKGKGKPAARAGTPAKAKAEPKGKGSAPAKALATARDKAAEGKPPSRPSGRKSSRRPSVLRRGPDGEILAPGDLLLPGGAQRLEEVLYLFRGSSAAEHPIGEEAVAEVLAKRGSAPEATSDRDDLARTLAWARERFEHGTIEPAIPPRPNLRRTFQGVVERAKQRRREIGAFLRGLDIGHTETSHMDAHGEASLVSLMKLAAGLENLAEAEEPAQTDANELHRVFEQLEAATESLIIDVEQTLRRLRDRVRA